MKIKMCFKFLKFIMPLITLVGVLWAIVQGVSTNRRMDLNTELANRPFVSIENPFWQRVENTDWFSSLFKITNYGNKPAEEFKIRNFRVILLRIENDRLRQKIKDRTKTGHEQYISEYFLDERNRLYLELLRTLSDFFDQNPDSNKTNTTEMLSGILKELKKRPLFSYKGKSLIALNNVNNDMETYYKKQEHLLFPNQSEMRGLTEQIGRGGINDIFTGDNLMVAYWAIRYKGFRKDKEYSTFYIGYCDKDILAKSTFNYNGRICYGLKEFKSWQTDIKGGVK